MNLGIGLNNLFIVGTPLQLLNAIEAVEHFKLENNILVIVHRSLKANKVQMDSIISLHKWKEVINIEYSKNSSILKYINLIKHLKRNSYKYIFIPKLEIVPKLVIANVEKKKVFLLDDGIMTISIYENNIKNKKFNKYNFKEIRFLFFGLKIKIKDKINLFTYFDLKPIHGIEVIKNELTFLKKTYLEGATKEDSCVFFLGHPSSKYIDDETYYGSLLNIVKKYNQKIVYIPHRGESEKSKAILSAMQNQFFSVLDINMPVELYFLENKIYPSKVLAYYSTALITLNIIYKECEISFIPIPLKNDINDALKNVYKIFDNEKLIRLNISDKDD